MNASDPAFVLARLGWEQANCINGLLCLCLGVPLNVLVVWLIAAHSTEELRAYKKVLLVTAAQDLFFLLFSFLVQPVGLTGIY